MRILCKKEKKHTKSPEYPHEALALQMLSNEKWYSIVMRHRVIISLTLRRFCCAKAKKKLQKERTNEKTHTQTELYIFLMLCFVSFPFGALAKKNTHTMEHRRFEYNCLFCVLLFYWLCCNHTSVYAIVLSEHIKNKPS